MKPIDVTDNYDAEYNGIAFNEHSMELHSNKKNLKFKVGDNVRILKYKKFLLKDILQIGQKRFLLLIK